MRLRAIHFAVVALLATGCVREDELDCQEAAAHLKSCCPGVNWMAVDCSYESGCFPFSSCEAPVPRRQFTIAESECIVAASCTRLLDTGVCDRATVATTFQINSDMGSAALICP